MSLTVTIHEGELKQIKRQIANKKSVRGHMFGLWTHSNQPVVQYITGSLKDLKREDIEELFEEHALRRVGIWSTEESGGDQLDKEKPCFVYMKVGLDNETLDVKPIRVIEKETSLKGILEVLKGDSAFRLRNPFNKKDQKKYYIEPVKGEIHWTSTSSQQAETKGEQWYSMKEGMELFGKIYGALQEKFEITGTSRDKDTHDLCVALKFNQRDFAVDFPSDFPDGKAILSTTKDKNISISLEKPVGKERVKDPKSGGKEVDDAVSVTPDDDQSEGAAASEQGQPAKDSDHNDIARLLVQGILKVMQSKSEKGGTDV